MMRPLDDILVIAVEQYGAGPFGSMHLADLGADIIKIENPGFGGDVGRYVPPFQQGEDSLFFESFNRNKRSISLDISVPAGRAVLEDLVEKADAVYSNLRGDVPKKLRIRYDDLKNVNPAIVCVSVSGFGMTGPRHADPGYDYILQGLAGWMSLTGEPDGPPTKTGLSLVDYCGGFVGALSLLAGIHAARRSGQGMDCDVSLYDTAVSLLTYPATWHLNEGWTPQRMARSAHPSLVPFQLFKASDGWLVIGCAKEKFWQRLTAVIGRPELADDPRYATFADRSKHAEELIEVLDDVFRTRTVADWVADLIEAGVPNGPIHSVAQALRDPHSEARHLIVKTEHLTFGEVRSLASPVRVGDPAEYSYRSAPRRNENAESVMHDLLGYDANRLAELTAEGAFGDPGTGA